LINYIRQIKIAEISLLDEKSFNTIKQLENGMIIEITVGGTLFYKHVVSSTDTFDENGYLTLDINFPTSDQLYIYHEFNLKISNLKKDNVNKYYALAIDGYHITYPKNIYKSKIIFDHDPKYYLNKNMCWSAINGMCGSTVQMYVLNGEIHIPTIKPQSIQTKTNQTKTNQTKTNQTKTNQTNLSKFIKKYADTDIYSLGHIDINGQDYKTLIIYNKDYNDLQNIKDLVNDYNNESYDLTNGLATSFYLNKDLPINDQYIVFSNTNSYENPGMMDLKYMKLDSTNNIMNMRFVIIRYGDLIRHIKPIFTGSVFESDTNLDIKYKIYINIKSESKYVGEFSTAQNDYIVFDNYINLLQSPYHSAYIDIKVKSEHVVQFMNAIWLIGFGYIHDKELRKSMSLGNQ
jgi:hypothetical protein